MAHGAADTRLRRRLILERRDHWTTQTREVTVYLRRRGESVEVLSAVCPHAGCHVQRKGQGFVCPCHRSGFNEHGTPLSGPSPRPLDPLEWRIEKGRLKVRYQSFRVGLAHRQALGRDG